MRKQDSYSMLRLSNAYSRIRQGKLKVNDSPCIAERNDKSLALFGIKDGLSGCSTGYLAPQILVQGVRGPRCGEQGSSYKYSKIVKKNAKPL